MAAQDGEDQTRKRVRPYRCFLVRCRLQENGGPAGQPAWRFTVQQAGAGGARRSFTCFDDVAAHMRAELASCGALAADESECEAATQGRPYDGAATEGRPYNGLNGVQERRQRK